jgi:15-cis-phytoene synthase
MDVPTQSWEYSLLARAYEALKTPASAAHLALADHATCVQAYAYCERLIRTSSRTFYLASGLLPWHKRRAMRALYAFCRATDDLIDRVPQPDDARAVLESWRLRLCATPNAYDPIALAWADTKARYCVPHGYETQLIDGIARDLYQHRYTSFAELTEYCYGVASTVGLMVMHITGYSSDAAVPYAVKLGIALQLTNILRDVGEDWQAGRLYLPLDELAQFGLSEADIALGSVDTRWRAFMRFQIARTRALYAEAAPGIALLDPDGRFAIAAAASLYCAILEDIEAHDYDVFRHRARVGFVGKARRLPGSWWAARLQSAPVAEPRGGA